MTMEPIKTTSGKTARANTDVLRQRRQLEREPLDVVIDKLDALADQAYQTIRMMRNEGNALRLLAVEAKQLTAVLRKKRPVDLEL